MTPNYKVKNVSAEDYILPYANTLIKAGETLELEQKIAQQLLSSAPYRVKLVVEDMKKGKTKDTATVVVSPKPAPVVAEDPLVPKTYQVKNTSDQDVTLAKGGKDFPAGRTVRAGETSEPMDQLEAQMFASYFQGKVELVIAPVETKAP